MPGRNDPCHCGSGKKYKKCCLDRDEQKAREELIPIESHYVDLEEEPSEPVKFEEEEWGDPDYESDECIESEADMEYSNEQEIEGNSDQTTNPTPELPEISESQDALISQWYDSLPKNNPVESMRRIREFMNEFPDLFVYLYIEDDLIFKIGDQLCKSNDRELYTELLEEIRVKHPEVYQRAFWYYDFHLILETIANGHPEAVSSYFDFYRKFPHHDCEMLTKCIQLFAFYGLEKELLEFVEINKGKTLFLFGGFDDDVNSYWPIQTELFKRIDSSDPPETIGTELFELFSKIDESIDETSKKYCTDEITFARSKHIVWDVTQCKTSEQITLFYRALCWQFCIFLHDSKGLGWVKSRFLANRLLEYWVSMPNKKKPKTTFRIVEKLIDNYIAQNYKDIFWINGISASGLIEAICYLVDFLDFHNQQAELTSSEIISICNNIYKRLLKCVDPTDPIHRISIQRLNQTFLSS